MVERSSSTGTAEVARWDTTSLVDRWTLATVVIGSVLAVVHVIHISEMLYYGLVGIVLEGVVPLVLAGILIASGPWLQRRGYRSSERAQVVKWMVVVAAIVGATFGWALSHQYLLGLPFPHAEFVMTTTLTAGGLLGIVIGLYDVRVHRHQAVIEKERETIANQRARLSVLNRVLRHNIRNDANVIHGSATAIAEQTEGAIAEQAELAASKTTGLVELSEKARQIDDTLSRGQAREDRVDLRSLATNVVAEYNQVSEHVEFDVDIPPELPRIQTSERILRRVLEELIENAIQHGYGDPYRIRLSGQQRDERIELVVADNGPGLPTHLQDVLDRGIETDLDHAGRLGLWLVKWGVESIDGELRFEESEWGGAAVHVSLPSHRGL